MTNPETEFTATLAERTIVVSWPDNERGGAVLPPDNWQERAWEERTLHEIDEGSISGCSVLRWRDDPRTDAELLAVSLALVTGKPAAVSVPPPAPQADDRGALRDRIRRAVCEAEGFMWNTELLEPDEYGEVADAVLAVLPESAPRADAEPDDGEGDELVCVDECGFCDACGFEPFGTPAEGWREAARFLRRTARDSGDRAGALHGARLIEAELRRLADESGPCVAGEQQNETPEAAPCDVPNGCEDGELCATHEEQQAHAEGEHAFCGVTCEVAMPTELMRNSLIAWAPPGGKGILAELERRAAAAPVVVAQPVEETAAGVRQDGAQP